MVDDADLDELLRAVRGLQSELPDQSVVGRSAALSSAPTSENSSAPTVFVSWAHSHSSWTSDEAIAWQADVATFAATLRQFGIDADIDLFHLDDRVDWTRYGARAIIDNEFTIVVMSEAWAERWSGTNDATEGAGAAREADTLHGLFSRHQSDWQAKLLIVMFPGVPDELIPPDLDRVTRVRIDSANPDDYEGLLRLFTGQPRYEKSTLGTLPRLPSLSSKNTLENLRNQLTDLRVRVEQIGKSKSAASEAERERLSMRESALRGFIDAALQESD
jgi:hypothetical protein